MSMPGGVGGLRREPHPTRLKGYLRIYWDMSKSSLYDARCRLIFSM